MAGYVREWNARNGGRSGIEWMSSSRTGLLSSRASLDRLRVRKCAAVDFGTPRLAWRKTEMDQLRSKGNCELLCSHIYASGAPDLGSSHDGSSPLPFWKGPLRGCITTHTSANCIRLLHLHSIATTPPCRHAAQLQQMGSARGETARAILPLFERELMTALCI